MVVAGAVDWGWRLGYRQILEARLEHPAGQTTLRQNPVGTKVARFAGQQAMVWAGQLLVRAVPRQKSWLFSLGASMRPALKLIHHPLRFRWCKTPLVDGP